MAGPDEAGPGVPPSTRVVEAVAAAAGVDELALTPLNDVIDPDALDALYFHRDDGEPRVGCAVQFEYGGYTVTVDHDGQVSVAE